MTVEVKKIVVKDIVKVHKNRTVASAKSLMSYFNLNALIVTDSDEPIGILTHGDIQRRVLDEKLDPHTVLVEEIVSEPLIWVRYNTTLTEVAEIMEAEKINKVPIFGNLSNGPILLGLYVYEPPQEVVIEN
ncbi:MAG: CBS domain-containing protein [Candidatus Bathyarchaeota archaeon]|nr:CBS domain-containing protein [Candidatus Bathyarchaeota archaeon]